jgi:hypothetical protein
MGSGSEANCVIFNRKDAKGIIIFMIIKGRIKWPDFSGRYMRLIQYYGDKYFNKIEKDVSTSFFCRMILNSV